MAFPGENLRQLRIMVHTYGQARHLQPLGYRHYCNLAQLNRGGVRGALDYPQELQALAPTTVNHKTIFILLQIADQLKQAIIVGFALCHLQGKIHFVRMFTCTSSRFKLVLCQTKGIHRRCVVSAIKRDESFWVRSIRGSAHQTATKTELSISYSFIALR